MPHTDFDIDRLAVYLHLTPQQVTRLVERGKLPGRKVAGAWRFAKAEIHHWFERRIGLSDGEELLKVEQTLQRSTPAEHQQEISIAEMLPIEAIAMPLSARTRNSVIAAMTELATEAGMLWDPKAMAEAVRSREDMHPTALENGVALMHPRRPMPKIISQPFLALGCTGSGIPFGSAAALSNVFFLICSTEDRGHLRVLARLSRMLTVAGFLDAMREATDAQAAHRLIAQAEDKL